MKSLYFIFIAFQATSLLGMENERKQPSSIKPRARSLKEYRYEQYLNKISYIHMTLMDEIAEQAKSSSSQIMCLKCGKSVESRLTLFHKCNISDYVQCVACASYVARLDLFNHKCL